MSTEPKRLVRAHSVAARLCVALLGALWAGCHPAGTPGPTNDLCWTPACGADADCPSGWTCVATPTAGIFACYPSGVTCGTSRCDGNDVCCVGDPSMPTCSLGPDCIGPTYACSSSANCSGPNTICCASADSIGTPASECSSPGFCSGFGVQLCASSTECPTGQTCQPTQPPGLAPGLTGYKACLAAPPPITCGTTTCDSGQVCCIGHAGGGSPVGCAAPSECPSDSVGYSCLSAADCPAQDVCCVEGMFFGSTCLPAAIGCGGAHDPLQLCSGADSSCPAGQTCQSIASGGGDTFMVCGAGPPTLARGDAQCAPGEVFCVGNTGGGSPVCAAPGECPSGSDAYPCLGAADCPAQEVCCVEGTFSGSTCVPAPSGCSGALQLCGGVNALCPQGQACQPTASGGEGTFMICQSGPPPPTCGGTQCDSGQVCCIGGAGGGSPVGCAAPGECPSDSAGYPCLGAADCPAQDVCCAVDMFFGSTCLPAASGCSGAHSALQLCGGSNSSCPAGQTCQPTASGGGGTFMVCQSGPPPPTCGGKQCDSSQSQVCCVSATGATKCAASCDCSTAKAVPLLPHFPSDASTGPGDSSSGDVASDAAADNTLGEIDAISDGGPGESDDASDSTTGTLDAPSGSDAPGNDASGLPTPQGLWAIAVDKNNYVFVAATNGIFVFNSAFQLVQVVPLEADAGGGIVSPNGVQGLAVDGAGHLLVVNFYETANDACFYSAASTLSGSDIARYVDNSGSGATLPLSLDTILIGSPNTPLNCAVGVAVAPDGTLFVAEKQSIGVFDAMGNAITSTGYPNPGSVNPAAIAVDPTSGYVYAADSENGAVYQFQYQFNQIDASGSSLTLKKTLGVNGGTSEPISVAVDSNGNLYVDDLRTDLVYVYSSAGASMGTIKGCAGPLAIDSTNRIYIACRTGEVRMYTKGSNGMWPMVGTVIVP